MSEPEYRNHPVADIFPMIAGEQFEAFKQDVSENGLQASGLLFEGMVLDGRNRYRACRELGLEMSWMEVELGEPDEIAAFDPVQYVVTHNLHRRHLTDTQRAMVAGKLATLKHGHVESQKSDPPNGGSSSVDDAATKLDVKPRAVERAKRIQKEADKTVIEMVEANELPLSTAEKLVKHVPDKQEQAKVAAGGKKAVSDHVKQLATVDPPAPEKPERARKVVPDLLIAFRRSSSKASDLKALIEELDPSFRMLLKSWLCDNEKEPSE